MIGLILVGLLLRFDEHSPLGFEERSYGIEDRLAMRDLKPQTKDFSQLFPSSPAASVYAYQLHRDKTQNRPFCL